MTDAIVWLDIETDRLNPLTANPIQVACIATNRVTLEELDHFEIKIHFNVQAADPSALERNCFDAEIWEKEAVNPSEAILLVSAFFKDYSTWTRISKRSDRQYTTCEIGGHNVAAYDAVVLSQWYKWLDAFCPAATWATGPVDTMHWARAIEFSRGERWESGFSLAALCERFNIVLEGEHNAMNDVAATVELARILKKLK
jgi:exonuclease I